jgi:hypothetical protein
MKAEPFMPLFISRKHRLVLGWERGIGLPWWETKFFASASCSCLHLIIYYTLSFKFLSKILKLKPRFILFHNLNKFNGRIGTTSNSYVDLYVIKLGHFSYLIIGEVVIVDDLNHTIIDN